MSITATTARRELRLLFVLVAASLVATAACAQQAPHTPHAPRPVPKPLTIEERIAASDLIVLAEAVRAFHTDDDGHEMPAEVAHPYQYGNRLTLRLKRVLKQGKAVAEVPNELTVSSPVDGSSLGELRPMYLGKDLIYFIRVGQWRRTKDAAPESFMQFPRGRWTVYPLGIEHLQDVQNTIDIRQNF